MADPTTPSAPAQPPSATPFASLSPAVHRASTIVFDTLRPFLERQTQFYDGYAYGQSGTPTYYELAHAIAALEGGGKAVLVPSGMAAIALVNATVLKAGDHVLLPAGAYASAIDAMRQLFGKWGVQHSFYPNEAGARIDAFLQPNTRLVWTESPSSLLHEMQDVPAIAAVARARGVRVAMDNSMSTPLGFRPLQHGVDFSVQSLTKYGNGHSDLLMGSVATLDESLYRGLRDTAEQLGHAVSSDDCFLVLRGLSTLGLRLERHAASGLAVARWLAAQPAVERVFYPPLPSDAGHALWSAQYTLGNGLLSFMLHEPGLAPVERFVDALQRFRIGPGWGGTHSLVEAYPPREASSSSAHGSPQGPAPFDRWIIRLHVGLEDPQALIDDLAQAFQRPPPCRR